MTERMDIDPVLNAVLDCPHDIDDDVVKLQFDPDQPGHNALNQLHRRIEAAASAEEASTNGSCLADDIRLVAFTGGAAPEGRFGRLTMRIDGELVEYVKAPAAHTVEERTVRCKGEDCVFRVACMYAASEDAVPQEQAPVAEAAGVWGIDAPSLTIEELEATFRQHFRRTQFSGAYKNYGRAVEDAIRRASTRKCAETDAQPKGAERELAALLNGLDHIEERAPGIVEVGECDEDGRFFGVLTINTDTYEHPEAAMPIARAIVAALARPKEA